MNWGFSEEEYRRVRDWLIAAMKPNPTAISEDILLEMLRSNEWHLITIENAACVLQLCIFENEKIANVLLLGGEKNKSLREIMRAYRVLSGVLKAQGFTKIVGTPRKEFHAYLKRNGFEQEQEELIKRL